MGTVLFRPHTPTNGNRKAAGSSMKTRNRPYLPHSDTPGIGEVHFKCHKLNFLSSRQIRAFADLMGERIGAFFHSAG